MLGNNELITALEIVLAPCVECVKETVEAVDLTLLQAMHVNRKLLK